MTFGLIRKVVLGALIASSISVAAWAACVTCQACNCSYTAHGLLHKQCDCVACTTTSMSQPQTVSCCQTGETCITNPTRKQNYEVEFVHFNCSSGTVLSCVDITSLAASGCCQ